MKRKDVITWFHGLFSCLGNIPLATSKLEKSSKGSGEEREEEVSKRTWKIHFCLWIMNFDFQMGVWGFKRIRNFGEARGKKKKNKSKTRELFSEPQSLVLLQNLELSFFILLPSLWGFWGFLSWNMQVKINGKFYLDFIGSPYNLERGQDEPPHCICRAL